MKKESWKVFAIFILALLLLGTFVSAQPSESLCDNIDNQWLKEKCGLWVSGVDLSTAAPKDISSVGETIKWFALIMIVLLVYSALSYASFPDSAWVRIAIAVPVGFLATFFITTNELITAMQSYSALGITLTVFFPFIILGFLTMVVASKGSPMGIYLQRIMWIIFSVFLLIRTYLLWSLKNAIDAGTITNESTNYSIFFGIAKMKITETIVNNMSRYDSAMLFTMMVASIAALFIMASNKRVTDWLAKEKVDAEVQAQKLRMQRSQEYDSARAEAMQGQ
jgi:hypothetical protein